MEGSVGGLASVRVPAGLDKALEAPSHVDLRKRAVDLLIREPFLVLVIALNAFFLSYWLPHLVAQDTWLALVGGRYVAGGGIPHHETLTTFAYGTTWIDQQWLGQLFFYWLHAGGGLRLLLLVHAAALVTAFGAALVYASRTGGSSRSVGLVGIVALFVAFPNSTARTQGLAYVLFVALFWLLASDLRSPSRRVLLALPILVFWANIHGSVVLGGVLVLLWAVAQVVQAGRRPGAGRARVRAAVLAVAAPLCLFVSPYGIGLFGYYHEILGTSEFRHFVTEWQATTFPEQWPFYALALPALWLTARKASRLSLFEHLAFVVMLIGGFEVVRNFVWFALVAAMVVPRALDGVWRPGRAPLRRRVNLVLSLSAIVLFVGAFAAAAARPSESYSKGYPRAAADVVASAAASDPSLRIFANERYADWLLWNAPQLSGRVAYDARFELLSSKQLQVLGHFGVKGTTDWLAAAKGYRLLVLYPNREQAVIERLRQERGTKVLYRDGDVVVLLRGTAR